MKNFSITGRVAYVGPNRFTVVASAIANDSGSNSHGEAIVDSAGSSDGARLRVYELVVTLADQIRRRGDRIESVRVE